MRQTGRITGTAQPVGQERLRLTESLLRAAEDSVSSLQRLLSEVRNELDHALCDSAQWERHDEVCALRQEVDQLREGLGSRAVIERAKGIFMQAHSVSEAQAFDLLNELSQRHHRKIRDLAADVVSGQLPPDPRTASPIAGPAPATASEAEGIPAPTEMHDATAASTQRPRPPQSADG